MKARPPSHAGSWYDDDPEQLTKMITGTFHDAKADTIPTIKGVIGPHAGYTYCAPTLAWSYANIDPSKYSRVMLIGPSHYSGFEGCALSQCTEYDTPMGPLPIDLAAIDYLKKASGFRPMTFKEDVTEHSLEMHTPYIKHVFKDKDIKIVPIMVGFMNDETHKKFADKMKEYFEDKSTLWAVSSDFCHWGSNFDYMPYNKSDGQIYQSIEKLDKMGIEAIESGVPNNFEKYIDETGNTICGNHAISIFMHGIANCKSKYKTQFTKYTQSEKIMKKSQSSVSYAAGFCMES